MLVDDVVVIYSGVLNDTLGTTKIALYTEASFIQRLNDIGTALKLMPLLWVFIKRFYSIFGK